MPRDHNLVEPESLVRHFTENPPDGFEMLSLDSGAPAFVAPFDLLTTTSDAFRLGARTLPGYSWWSRVLKPTTAFIGTTVTEFAPLPVEATTSALLRDVIPALTTAYPFVIVKDLPTEATLVSAGDLKASIELASACQETGFVLVEGQALAYVPIDFASIDDLLARRSPARRKNLRRKLKSRSVLDITEIRIGDSRFSDDAFLASLYAMYRSVYEQSTIHFDLLTPSFFRAVLQDATIDGVVFLYRANGVLIGYNICVRSEDRLVDKYVGFVYPAAREHNLYAVSWFHNLEYARAHGLRWYIAGWTDREVKRELGAHFTFTRHAVYVRNPMLRMFLRMFKPLFEGDHA